MARSFESGPARRERAPIAIGVVGPSGSGKTLSTILVAEGMQRVHGGETWLIDTNNRRSLHHADAHSFNVVHMPPPYSPEDCQAACQHAIDNGARRIIFDSISDLHEGIGGILQMHEEYIDAKTNNSEDWKTRDKQNMTAWKVVKRKQLMFKLWMFQQPVDWLLTFRAKEKITLESGGKPVNMGWQPLGPEELVYEMLFMCMLPPRADGRPIWTSPILQEQVLMKLPKWFRGIFKDSPPLSADIGEQLARWAAGGDVRSTTATSRPTSQMTAHPLLARYAACADRVTWDEIELERGRTWKATGADDKIALKAASSAAMERITLTPPPDDSWKAEALAQEAKENR